MRARPTLSWAWHTAKLKCLELGWLLSPTVLGMAWVSGPHYLGLGALLNPSALDLANCQVQTHWVWHACQMLPWTWRNAKSKCIGSGIRARPTPPCTWHTAKSKHLGNYLGLDWLPRPNALGLVCVSDPRHLGLDTLPSPIALPMLPWI
jgi:hypothetical protein